MFHPSGVPPGMSDGGSDAGRRPLLLGDLDGPPERVRDKEPRGALESAKLRAEAAGGGGGGGGGLKDLAAGTSASSPGSSKECAPETDSQTSAGEADYCRRILVRAPASINFPVGPGPQMWPLNPAPPRPAPPAKPPGP